MRRESYYADRRARIRRNRHPRLRGPVLPPHRQARQGDGRLLGDSTMRRHTGRDQLPRRLTGREGDHPVREPRQRQDRGLPQAGRRRPRDGPPRPGALLRPPAHRPHERRRGEAGQEEGVRHHQRHHRQPRGRPQGDEPLRERLDEPRRHRLQGPRRLRGPSPHRHLTRRGLQALNEAHLRPPVAPRGRPHREGHRDARELRLRGLRLPAQLEAR